MPCLSDLADAPTPVQVHPSVDRSGRLMVHPLRVVDLAEMEAWASALAGDPMAGVEAAESIEDEVERRKAMRAILDRCRNWPITPWSDEWSTAFGSEAGSTAMLWFILRRSFPPGWSLADAAVLAGRLTFDEIAAIHAASWKSDRFRALLVRTMGGGSPSVDDDDDGDGRRYRLGEWVVTLVRLGVPLEAVMQMPLKALLAAGQGMTADDEANERTKLPEVAGLGPDKLRKRFLHTFGREED